MNTLNSTPRSNRLHISIFGKTNSGKSTLFNALTSHSTSLVSPIDGTTTDPVYKSIELYGLGPCVLIDTAGFNDSGDLGELRVKKTQDIVKKTDLAILLFSSKDINIQEEINWANQLKKENKPYLAIISKTDLNNDIKHLENKIKTQLNINPLKINFKTKDLQHNIRKELIKINKGREEQRSIVSHLVGKDDVVMLVMPQQINAPEGRLILPQVQTIRDLLDHHSIVISITTDEFDSALTALKNPPKLIIVDSQIFPIIYPKKPVESTLTSFSILLSAVKGDVEQFALAAHKIDCLTEDSKVLIAEACSHAPLSEDIGRVQIPRMLRNKIGDNLKIDHVNGSDFPDNLEEYDLVIHCAGCMFNRSYMMNRLNSCRDKDVSMTNYGIVIAKLSGILDKVKY